MSEVQKIMTACKSFSYGCLWELFLFEQKILTELLQLEKKIIDNRYGTTSQNFVNLRQRVTCYT